MKLYLNSYNSLRVIFFITLLSSTYSEKIPTKEYSSYRRYPWCTPSDITRYPKTLEEVVDIVQEAIHRGVTVKIFGERHSQTDIICTEGIPIDSRGIRFFRMNDDGVTATFGSGVNLRDATEFLRKNNRGLRTTPAYGNITLGGAIGTGSHGSTIRYNASISSQVVGLTIVDGRGFVRKITDSADLRAFRLNLGLLGIVFDITLYTVPLYKTLAHNYAVTDDVLTNGVAKHWAQTTDQICFYWFPAFKEVVVANWTIVDVETPGNAWTNDHVPPTYDNFNVLTDFLKEILFGMTASTCALANSLGYKLLHVLEYYLELALLIKIPDFVPIYTEDGFRVRNPAVGYYDLMFAPICYDDPQGILGAGCPWASYENGIEFVDNEFAIGLEDLADVINDVKDIVSKTPTAFPMQGILLRFSDTTDIYMSTAYGKPVVHFEFYEWKRRDHYKDPTGSLAGYQTILQTLTRKYNARSHWGKSGLAYHDSQSLDIKLDYYARENFIGTLNIRDKFDPLNEFAFCLTEAMNKFDPNEIFLNNFGRRIKRKGTTVDTDPLTIHCALLGNCICSTNSDCGDTQICTTIPGYDYYVCKTRNEPAEATIMDKSKLPPPFGVVGFLLSNIFTSVRAAFANCTSS